MITQPQVTRRSRDGETATTPADSGVGSSPPTMRRRYPNHEVERAHTDYYWMVLLNDEIVWINQQYGP